MLASCSAVSAAATAAMCRISKLTHPSAIAHQGVFALLESLPPPEKGSIIEHVVAVRVQGPVAALAGLLVVPRNLHETLVQGQVVSY